MKTETRINDLRTAVALAAVAAKKATAEALAVSYVARSATSPDTVRELTALAATQAEHAAAALAVAKIPAARRAAAELIRRGAEGAALNAARRLGGDYSGTTNYVVSWGDEPAAATTTGRGERYSRSCKYSKINATHRVVIGYAGALGLADRPGIVAASSREGLPLLALDLTGTGCTWLRAKGKTIVAESGHIAHSPEFGGVCYHADTAEKAAKGLAKKLAGIRESNASAAEAARAFRFSPAGKAARRAALVARLCAGAVATIEDARALGFCAPGIAAFQARTGLGDRATLPELIRTGEPHAVRLALHLARKVSAAA